VTGDLEAALRRLPPIDLAGLSTIAPLLARRDRKYVLSTADAVEFSRYLPPTTRLLTIDGHRSFRYESVYFDTPDFDAYLASARRRPRRFKVRTRTYVDSGTCLLEIKRRDARGRTVKDRIERRAGRNDRLDDADRSFLAAQPATERVWGLLEPVLSTTYARSTLLLVDGVRVTMDVGVLATDMAGRQVRLDDMVVIETKSHRAPSSADRMLWSMGHRPVRVSKFCTSLAVLRPDLPSNRWTQALRQSWLVLPDTPVAVAS
jgi:VTC domain